MHDSVFLQLPEEEQMKSLTLMHLYGMHHGVNPEDGGCNNL